MNCKVGPDSSVFWMRWVHATFGLGLIAAFGLQARAQEPTFIRADSNADGTLDISDPINTLGYLFTGDSKVTCQEAADANDDGNLDISDAVYTLAYLFVGGPEPSLPFTDCGVDLEPDTLGCVSFSLCPGREPSLESLQSLDRFVASHAGERDEEAGDGESSLDRLLMQLRFLRGLAYPNDEVDWEAYHHALQASGQGAGGDVDLTPVSGCWEFIGPQGPGIGQYCGRVNAVAFDPQDSKTLYAGGAAGGVWKTIDGGDNWVPLSNAWQFETVSAIAVDPKNSSTLYVGTGDFHFAGPTMGLMKSTDAGQSFVNLAGMECGQSAISRIAIDPENPNILVITCGRGSQGRGRVWRSANYGVSWQQVIAVDAVWADVEIGSIDSSGRRWYYAVGWNAQGGLLYRSSDRGVTWTPLRPPWTSTQFGVGVAPSLSTPSTVYVLAGADKKVFSSLDAGSTWKDVTGNLSQNSWDWNQLWYDWYIKCSLVPGNPPSDVIYVGLKHLFRSEAGRTPGSWQVIASGHDDQHDMAIDPHDPNHLLIGNDGGAFSMTYVQAGGTWNVKPLNATLGVTQLYTAAFTRLDPSTVLGAAQDNGSPLAKGSLGNWSTVFGPRSGDSVGAAILESNPRVQFISVGVNFYGIVRTDDCWLSQKEITPPLAALGQGDVIRGDRTALAISSTPPLLLWGTRYLNVWDEQNLSSPWSLSVGGQPLSGPGGAIAAIAVAAGPGARVYTGSWEGQVWMSSLGNWNWTQVDGGSTTLPNRSVLAISINPLNQASLLVGLGGTGTGHLWRCDNANASVRTWVNVSGNGSRLILPDLPVNGIARNPNDPENSIYVGTDLGVYFTSDGGLTWRDYTRNWGLPSTRITGVCIAGDNLYAVTFGRGIWRNSCLPNYTHLLGVTSDGHLWHTIRDAKGSWEPLRDVELEGTHNDIGSAFEVDAARDGSGRLHVCALNNQGRLYHAIRNPEVPGLWTLFGDVSVEAGERGGFTDVGCAPIGSGVDLSVAAVNPGQIFHTVRRHNDGSWRTFADVEINATGEIGFFQRVASSEIHGSLHVCGITLEDIDSQNRRIWHTVRRPDGSWFPFGDIEVQAGERGSFVDVGCAGIGSELHVCGVTSDGHLWHTIRRTDGSWFPFGDIEKQAGDQGPFSAVSCAGVGGELQVAVIKHDGRVLHTIRQANGSWLPFGDVEGQAGERGAFVAVSIK